ncbi:MAG: nuclear transport factor 2 family protein [Gemmatimonadota bacterium]|nr:nuclear transport factor 2 family protein [Gemmatimonadota bacterium]MDH3366282.1 nuclear transport factor 2 family protein [Gemmatimonadota bacterium]MDH3477010.1 nuclear transport factor 2 family protein [Gemmatimonadota bacterium]MDH3569114.1 nuclear transport factor 2 family protein [Gemmatimonadota bacterium]MDH5548975.1 nuclear transport factor 2 family protein [Gemmatimonadota bacterium]
MRHSPCVLCLLLLSACAAGRPPLDDAERAAIAASVDSATRAFEDAERARDAERVIAHLAPEFYMYNDGIRADYASAAASIRRSLGSFRHFEPGFENLEVRVLGPHGAVVSFTFQDSIVDGTGQLLRFRGPTTLVWELRGNGWRITYADADHYQDIPR